MSKLCRSANKVWTKFSMKRNDGSLKKMLIKEWEEKSIDNVLLDFFIKHYVARESTHVISGIPQSQRAMEEYRNIFKSRIENHYGYKILVCCPEDEESEIVGLSTLKLLSKDIVDEDLIKPQTEEVKKFFELMSILNKLSPVPDLMKQFNAGTFYDDHGTAVLPEYSGVGIAAELIFTRRKLCTGYGVPMGGAWVTSKSSAKAAWSIGCETVLEIDPEALCRQLEVPMKNPAMITKYLFFKQLHEQLMDCSAREYIKLNGPQTAL